MKERAVSAREHAPHRAQNALVSPTAARASTADCPRRLLLVDDSETVRVTTALLLRSSELDVVEAGCGEEAVSRYRSLKGTIDLVLLDMQMPGMDGLETFRALKATDASIRVVIISGAGRTARVEQTLCEGALAFLPKPFSRDDLSATVRRYIIGLPDSAK